MSERAWTPGPWITDNVDVFALDITLGVRRRKICHLTNSSRDGRIIAAAPQLFEALDEAINYVAILNATHGYIDGKPAALLSKCTAALHKALGSPQ